MTAQHLLRANYHQVIQHLYILLYIYILQCHTYISAYKSLVKISVQQSKHRIEVKLFTVS